MGKEEDKDKDLDQEEMILGLTSGEVVMLAYAVEYECGDDVNDSISNILEKIEQGLHVDTYIGNRLAEYGRIMGWSKEL